MAAAMSLFDPVINKIITHLKETVDNETLVPFDCILIAGGFSECKLLQETIKKEFAQK